MHVFGRLTIFVFDIVDLTVKYLESSNNRRVLHIGHIRISLSSLQLNAKSQRRYMSVFAAPMYDNPQQAITYAALDAAN